MNPLPPEEYLRKFGAPPKDEAPKDLRQQSRKQRRAAVRAAKKGKRP